MSLKEAIQTGDLSLLPSRRDEDWRWTDLRGLIRELGEPEPLKPGHGAVLAPEAPWSWVRWQLGGWEAKLHKNDAVIALSHTPMAVSSPGHRSEKVRVPSGVSGVLLEHYGTYFNDYVSSLEIDIELEPGAKLERIVLADEMSGGVTVSQARVKIGEGASFSQTIITTGAKRQRIETHVEHPGAGASVRLDGVYLVSGKRHADITTVVEHQGAGGATSQLVKGAVSAQGRGVFQGRILVSKGADQTDARMGHHALILSERGEVDSKPELLIYADDVACAHGNTVGALDENVLFYARQRGMPEEEAKALLTEAFIGEVIDRIEYEEAREGVRAWVSEKLQAMARDEDPRPRGYETIGFVQ